MKKVVFVLSIVGMNFVFANHITQAVQISKQCRGLISQAPQSTIEKYCSAVYNYSFKLNTFSSYRSFERMETLRKIQKIAKSINGDKHINEAINKELSRNHNHLKSIWWPHTKLSYLDVELKNGKLFLLFNKKNNSIIQYDMRNLPKVSSKKGKQVFICTPENICEKIQGNLLQVKQGLFYNTVRVLTSQGTFQKVFTGGTKIPNLAGLAYEINAQLYDKKAPSLSRLDIQTIVPPLPKNDFHRGIVNENEITH